MYAQKASSPQSAQLNLLIPPGERYTSGLCFSPKKLCAATYSMGRAQIQPTAELSGIRDAFGDLCELLYANPKGWISLAVISVGIE